MTMITPSYLGETIEYSSLHACRSTLEDPTITRVRPRALAHLRISTRTRSPRPVALSILVQVLTAELSAPLIGDSSMAPASTTPISGSRRRSRSPKPSCSRFGLNSSIFSTTRNSRIRAGISPAEVSATSRMPAIHASGKSARSLSGRCAHVIMRAGLDASSAFFLPAAIA